MKQMNVVFLVHYYPPGHFAGSETMLHAMAKRLQAENIGVKVYVTGETEQPNNWEYDGVQVINMSNESPGDRITEISEADLIITHHNNADFAACINRMFGTKIALVVHNEMNYSIEAIRNHNWNLLIFNTVWVREKCEKNVVKKTQSIVLHPPVDIDKMTGTKTGEFVTLVNLNEHKGGKIFYEIAARMPDVKFLGVVGGHGIQIHKQMDNVTIIGQTDEMLADVYEKSKIVLMPSLYESFGMVSVEAIANGVPVIANFTPGLQEALGDAGLFVARESVVGYCQTIRQLLTNRRQYEQQRVKAKQRAAEIKQQTEKEFMLFVENVKLLQE